MCAQWDNEKYQVDRIPGTIVICMSQSLSAEQLDHCNQIKK